MPISLFKKRRRYIPGDPKLSELTSKCAVTISIETEPPGAQVSMKKYSAPNSDWEFLGVSPLRDIRLPMGIFRWNIEKEDCETIQAAAFTYKRDESRKYFNIPDNLKWVLVRKGSLPPGMVARRSRQGSGCRPDRRFFYRPV